MTRTIRIIFGALFLLAGLRLVSSELFGLGTVARAFGIYVYAGLELAALTLCVVRLVKVPTNRLPWALFTGFILCTTIGDTVTNLYLIDLPAAQLNVADVFYLSGMAAAYGGIVTLLRSHQRSFPPSMWLDGLVVGLTLTAICAAVVFGPIAGAMGDGMTVAVVLSYPLWDILLLCLIGVAFGLAGWRAGPAWTLVGIAVVSMAVGDVGWAWMEASRHASEASQQSLIEFWEQKGITKGMLALTTCWPLSYLLIAFAAWLPQRRAVSRTEGMEVLAVPGVFAAIALGLLVYAPLGDVPLAATVIAALALLAGGVRAGLTLRENVVLLRRSRAEAMTDGLTGMPNRRQLMLDLDETLAVATETHPHTLAFFDLDGFKGYNDAFGHNAGDLLLSRVGRELCSIAEGQGRAYRLGGDEFCMLAPRRLDRSDPMLLSALAALSEEGEGFAISASSGIALLPADGATATQALQLADERMYADKDTQRRSARVQVRDLLVQVLRERERGLNHGSERVAELAAAVGRRLALPAEAHDELTRAAELHDVGKLAVPDSILDKPGPLSAVEWDLIRQHPSIGERILAAAPALKPVARLLRSSHERWDGTGYPDRLTGEQIPLGSRVIAACGAYDAMTSDRPYRHALSRTEAIDELRRGAGTQFDANVVGLLLEVLAGFEARAEPATAAP